MKAPSLSCMIFKELLECVPSWKLTLLRIQLFRADDVALHLLRFHIKQLENDWKLELWCFYQNEAIKVSLLFFTVFISQLSISGADR